MWKNEEGTRFESNPYEDKLYQFIDVQWTDGPVPGSYFDSEIYKDFALFLDEWAATDPDLLGYFGRKVPGGAVPRPVVDVFFQIPLSHPGAAI